VSKEDRSLPKVEYRVGLNVLIQPPFECMALADFKIVTWVTIFLVLLVSRSTASEVQALEFNVLEIPKELQVCPGRICS